MANRSSTTSTAIIAGFGVAAIASWLFLKWRASQHAADASVDMFEHQTPVVRQPEVPEAPDRDSDWETEDSEDQRLEDDIAKAAVAYLKTEFLRLSALRETQPATWTAEQEEELQRVIEDLREFMKMGQAGVDDDLRTDEDEWDEEYGDEIDFDDYPEEDRGWSRAPVQEPSHVEDLDDDGEAVEDVTQKTRGSKPRFARRRR